MSAPASESANRERRLRERIERQQSQLTRLEEAAQLVVDRAQEHGGWATIDPELIANLRDALTANHQGQSSARPTHKGVRNENRLLG